MSTSWNSSVLAIGRDRLFYCGLAGNSKQPRSIGSFSLYFSTEGHFEISIDDGPWQKAQAALVTPFQRHRLLAPDGIICNLGMEPESLSPEAQARLGFLAGSPDHMTALQDRTRRLRHRMALVHPEDLTGGGFSNAEFDTMFFDEPFAPPQMDQRISRVLDEMCAELADSTASADDYADMVGLSPSRFLYLFKLNTGVPFRAMRMWKRARRFLDHANGNSSLTDVALDLGYPDSSHFSHSIRRIYGLKPRSIRQGSKHLKVFTGANYRLAPEALVL